MSPDILCEKKTASHLEKRSLYRREGYYGRLGVPKYAKVCKGVPWSGKLFYVLNDQLFHMEVKGII